MSFTSSGLIHCPFLDSVLHYYFKFKNKEKLLQSAVKKGSFSTRKIEK